MQHTCIHRRTIAVRLTKSESEFVGAKEISKARGQSHTYGILPYGLVNVFPRLRMSETPSFHG